MSFLKKKGARLLLLFRTPKNLPSPGKKFVVTASGKQVVTASGKKVTT